jgi:hypothetical protein
VVVVVAAGVAAEVAAGSGTAAAAGGAGARPDHPGKAIVDDLGKGALVLRLGPAGVALIALP